MQAVVEMEVARLVELYERLPLKSRWELVDFADYLVQRHGESRKSPQTSVDEVAGCLLYRGPAKTIQQMDAAIATGIRHQWAK